MEIRAAKAKLQVLHVLSELEKTECCGCRSHWVCTGAILLSRFKSWRCDSCGVKMKQTRGKIRNLEGYCCKVCGRFCHLPQYFLTLVMIPALCKMLQWSFCGLETQCEGGHIKGSNLCLLGCSICCWWQRPRKTFLIKSVYLSSGVRLHTTFDPLVLFLIHTDLVLICVCECVRTIWTHSLFSLSLCTWTGQYVEDRGEEGQPLSTSDGSWERQAAICDLDVIPQLSELNQIGPFWYCVNKLLA